MHSSLSHKIRLQGFNNLSKSLNLSLYLFSYKKTPFLKNKYLACINNNYNTKYLNELLSSVALMIDATVLNIAVQDYEPHGASAALLIAEEPMQHNNHNEKAGKSMVGHLDKSHLTVHTYPEYHPFNGICTFRADIDLSTCGNISPLTVLNFLIYSFNPHLTIIDYYVRGFTRSICGKKYYIDHSLNSIQEYLSTDIKKYYQIFDVNFKGENIFRTKMVKDKLSATDYLGGMEENNITKEEKYAVECILQQEILEILNQN